jgi:predicted MFS family arabinose efflux permease
LGGWSRDGLPSAVGRPSSYRWTILAVLTTGQTLASFVGLCVLPLAPFVQVEFGITRAQVGVLISALYIGAMFSSLPAGWLTELVGSRALLVASQVVVAAGVLLLAWAPSFSLALVVMPVVGLGYGGINPMSTKAIIDWFAGHVRATAMSVKQTGFALGNALAAATLPSLAVAAGWRAALMVASVTILVSAAVGGWLFREAPAAARPARARVTPRDTYASLLRNRDLMIAVGTGILLAAIQLVVSGYLVLFLSEHVRLPVVLAGAMLSITQLAGVVGRVGWGVVSDRLAGGRRRAVLVTIGACSSAAAALASLLGPDTPTWMIAACAALLGVTAVGWNGVFATLTSELAAGGSIAGASGLATGANFLGVVIGPPLFGLAVDLSGSYALGWRLVAVAGLCNVAVLSLVREKR